MIRFTAASSSFASNIITPTIIMRFVGCSMTQPGGVDAGVRFSLIVMSSGFR